MGQETFTLTLDQNGAEVEVVINDTSAPPPAGAVAFTTVGTSQWTVPGGITSISAVAVGGGGGGFGYWDTDANWLRTGTGGNGGDLSWGDLTVTPGETLDITVGGAGQSDTSSGGAYGNLNNSSTAGGSSYISRSGTVLLRGKGGNASGQSNGDTNIGDGGATGGAGGYDGGKQYGGQGGGGAAGYSGDGTNGMPGGFSQYNAYFAETPSGGSASGGDGVAWATRRRSSCRRGRNLACGC